MLSGALRSKLNSVTRLPATRWNTSFRQNSVKISDEVREALSSKQTGVVALETAVVTHGLPQPMNYEVALDMMRIVRSHDCVPALIGVRKGTIQIGMSESELAEMADCTTANASSRMKVAKRDIGYCVTQQLNGGTTVSATACIAASAGISVFATGGIGGVHRNAENTFDISSDLVELGKLPICVVCAGCKSILDIPKTLEYLETQSVQVATLGNDRSFPAFFLPKSDSLSPIAIDTTNAAAKLCHTTFDVLQQRSGILIAVPIPLSTSDNTEQLSKLIEEQLRVAISEMGTAGHSGKDVTPFLLQRLAALTKNATVTLNVALLKHNAEVASKIAKDLNKLRLSADLISNCDYDRKANYNTRWTQAGTIREKVSTKSAASTTGDAKSDSSKAPPRLIVVGGALHETTIRVRDKLQIRDILENRLPSKSIAGNVATSSGGVGRNVADCVTKLGASCTLLSAVQTGDRGSAVMRSTAAHLVNAISAPLDQSAEPATATAPALATASYVSIIDQSGNLLFGVNDTAICDAISPQFVDTHEYLFDFGDVGMVCFDANIPVGTMNRLIEICHERRIPIWFEPTSADKARKLLDTSLFKKDSSKPPLVYISPNYEELVTLCGDGNATNGHNLENRDAVVKHAIELCDRLHKNIPSMIVFVKLGPLGVLVAGKNNKIFTGYAYYSSFNQKSLPTTIVNVTGAGDCFVAGVINGLLHQKPLEYSVQMGLKSAWHSLQDANAVSTFDVAAFNEDAVRSWITTAQIQEIKIKQ